MTAEKVGWLDYCRQLELNRARRLLNRVRPTEPSPANPVELEQALIQTVLLAALQGNGRGNFNFAVWLETLAAVRDPATPRSLTRTSQLLSEEVLWHDQRLIEAIGTVGQPAGGAALGIPLHPSLQRRSAMENGEQPLEPGVHRDPLAARSGAERALFAIWLEWRGTHPQLRSRLHRGAGGASALAPYSESDLRQAENWLARRLAPGQRTEFEQAIRAAQPGVDENLVRYTPPALPRNEALGPRQRAFIAVLLVLWIAIISFSRFGLVMQESDLDKPPGSPKEARPPVPGFEHSGDGRRALDQVPIFDPGFRPPETALVLLAELDEVTMAQLLFQNAFRRWLNAAGTEPERMSAFDRYLLPGPRTRQAISERRRQHQQRIEMGRETAADKNAANRSRLGIAWFRETWPVWNQEIVARGDAVPADRVPQSLQQLSDETLAAWAAGNRSAEDQVDELIFKDSPGRAAVARYRQTVRDFDARNPAFSGFGNTLPLTDDSGRDPNSPPLRQQQAERLRRMIEAITDPRAVPPEPPPTAKKIEASAPTPEPLRGTSD